MIEITKTETYGWESAIRGMRNPMNSWCKSDSYWKDEHKFVVGDNDMNLMKSLVAAGSDHRKYLRMINVTCDITAPLYWWKEYDTYKVGTVANSCSTMHKIHAKEFTLDDFSFEHLLKNVSKNWLDELLEILNVCRDAYNDYDSIKDTLQDGIDKKDIWYMMIQLLPSSYNQKRTVQLNYEVLRNMYHARKNHKLDEWREFCRWVETLPCAELITDDQRANQNSIDE